MHNINKNDLVIYQMIVSKVTYRTLISGNPTEATSG